MKITLILIIIVIGKIIYLSIKAKVICSPVVSSNIDLKEKGKKYNFLYSHYFPCTYEFRLYIDTPPIDYEKGVTQDLILNSLSFKLKLNIYNKNRIIIDKIINNKGIDPLSDRPYFYLMERTSVVSVLRSDSSDSYAEVCFWYFQNPGEPKEYRMSLEILEPETSKFYENAKIEVRGAYGTDCDPEAFGIPIFSSFIWLVLFLSLLFLELLFLKILRKFRKL